VAAAAGGPLDAVGSVLLDGLSYRRAGRAVGISKTEVGDSLDLLLGPLAALGFCQPDGSFVTSLDQLGRWLAEMTASGAAVLLDGLATRVQRPGAGATRRCCTTPSGTPTPPWALSRWRGLLWRVRDVFRAAGALICLGRWLHRVPA